MASRGLNEDHYGCGAYSHRCNSITRVDMRILFIITAIFISFFISRCARTEPAEQTYYRNGKLRYSSSFSFNNDTLNTTRLYPALQWEPTGRRAGENNPFTFDRKTGIAILARTPTKYSDTFYKVPIPGADSLKIKKKIDDFSLLGVFRNKRLPSDLYTLLYWNDKNDDVLLQYHLYRIGNISDMCLFHKDSVNYLKNNKNFQEKVAGKNYHFQMNNTYILTPSGSSN